LQTTGPLLGGYLLAWSMDDDHFYPFNYHLVFLIMVGITFAVLGVIKKLEFTDKNKSKLKSIEDVEDAQLLNEFNPLLSKKM